MFKQQAPSAPPAPTIDDAEQRRQQRDMAQRRATTILTSENGLPNLGTTTRPQAG